MRISELAYGHKSKTAGHWNVEVREENGHEIHTVYHYNHLMVQWDADDIDGSIFFTTGHGTVSDQGGINQICRALGVPYRMDRDRRGGGPRITYINHAA